MASGLLRSADICLPNELALLVIHHLADDNETLCTLARTCRGLQHLAEERIYKTIELLSVKTLHAIINAFNYRHDRVRAVQTLKILYQYRQEDLKDSEEPRTSFNECVTHMVNLREWHIESPFDNFNWGKEGGQEWVCRDMQRFRRALEVACVDGPKEADLITAERRLGNNMDRTVGLALLQNLTIHSHGVSADFWELEAFHCLFRHPNLRHLHVSCVTFPKEEIAQLASHVNKTPLTSLVFDECELEPKSLLSILRTPAKLKQLTLGENVFNINRSRRIRPALTNNAAVSLEALSAVAHSLERLTHLDPGGRINPSPHILRTIRPPGDGMRAFHSLKYMECDTDSFLHQAIVMNRDLAPPNLEILRVRRHWDVPVDFWDQPPAVDPYLALPSLSTLDLIQSTFLGQYELSDAEYICDGDRLRSRHAKAYRLWKAGINLKLLIEMHSGSNLIPPYLHGERVPIIQSMYDASVVGFHRHIEDDDNGHVRSEVSSSEIRNGLSHSQSDEDLSDVDSSSAHEPTPPIEYQRLDESHSVIATNPDFSAKMSEEAPETDQLGDADIRLLTGETRRALVLLKHRFVRRGRRVSSLESFTDSDDDEFGDEDMEVDDLDEDEDMELELELADDDGFEDEGLQIYEHNGELYIEVYEGETDDEEEMDASLLGGQVQNDDVD